MWFKYKKLLKDKNLPMKQKQQEWNEVTKLQFQSDIYSDYF